MYKGILFGRKGYFTAITIILAVIFVIIYNNNLYASVKSEEDLLEETRANIDKYLDEMDAAKAAPKMKAVEAPTAEEDLNQEAVVSEEEPAATGKTTVPRMELAAVEKKVAGPQEETPEVKEPVPPPVVEKRDVKKVEEKPAVQPKPQIVEKKQEPSQEKPVKEKEESAPVVKKENISPDLEPITVIKDDSGKATDKQSGAKGVDLISGLKNPVVGQTMEEPVLKKMDINRIGASPYYETYEGLRLLKYFTVAQRVEIYQEPRPIDSYMLDAYAMRLLYGVPWNLKSDYRTQITPLFTRAYGTEITMSDPKDKEGQIRYTHDYRDIYKNYWPKWPWIQRESWDQNEILLMHSKEIEPIGWLYASNIGYRYSTMSAKSDDNYYEIRHTYFGSLSLAPTDKIEYFFQGEYYKSMHVKSSFDYRPDHFLGRTEVRIKSKDYKTTFVPQFSYSKDFYYPFADTFEKYEIALRVGRDFTNKFSATSTVKYVYSNRDEPDNSAPLYDYVGENPHKDKAEYISLENRFSYNVYDKLYLQGGLDISNGLNWSIFDNWGLLGGLEYYAPGIIRVDVGWRGNYYYKLTDFLSSVYFKFYLFM